MPRSRKSEPRSPEHAALGAAIEQLRKQAGLSQEALSDAAGIHATHIGGLERGVRNPSYSTLVRLAAALDSRVGALTTLADELLDR
jgi:transcriptional regulator with XRE-family HTH domain